MISNKKNILLLVLLLSITGIINAQKVKLKKGIVYIDGNETLKYEKRFENTELLLFPLEGEEETIFIKYDGNGTRGYNLMADDFIKIHFIKQNLKLESGSHAEFWKQIIKWMAQNKIFNTDGTLNDEKVEKFVDRYHEEVKKN